VAIFTIFHVNVIESMLLMPQKVSSYWAAFGQLTLKNYCGKHRTRAQSTILKKTTSFELLITVIGPGMWSVGLSRK
jgi:hypothetical protein